MNMQSYPFNTTSKCYNSCSLVRRRRRRRYHWKRAGKNMALSSAKTKEYTA